MRTLLAFAVCLLVLVTAAAGRAEDRLAEDRNPGHLKIALANIKCLYSAYPDAATNRANIESNLKRHLKFIELAVAEGAEFVGFPELSINGYTFGPHMTWLSLDGPEVKLLAEQAARHGIYVSAGLAEQDADGKRWNTQIVIGPDGRIVGRHHKIYLTKEAGHVEVGSSYDVFDVKGLKMGIAICADGSDPRNIHGLVDNGAEIIYGPHANTTGGTTAGWYRFRSSWGGPDGLIAKLKVYAALHNHAGRYNPELDPPTTDNAVFGWASGAWFIGPDGSTLARMPSSGNAADSLEHLLIYNVPLPRR